MFSISRAVFSSVIRTLTSRLRATPTLAVAFRTPQLTPTRSGISLKSSDPRPSEAVGAARPGGTVVWVGVAEPEAEVSIKPYDVFRRELTIRGSYTNPYTMGRSLALLASRTIGWEAIVTHRLPLSRFDEAWEAHRQGTGLKVCVRPAAGES